MIALVSSTIFPGPAPVYADRRSVFSAAERLAQTRATIASLLAAGLSEIHIADNSGSQWVVGTEQALEPAAVHRFTHYQFRNRGIAETYLLLEALEALPDRTPILKISGRYGLKNDLRRELGDADVAARWEAGDTGISTRCYLVRDREVYRRFLEDTLNEVYGDAARVHGPRSFVRLLRNSLFPTGDRARYFDPTIAIERGAARALLKHGYAVHRIPDLGLEGEIATSRDAIRE